jgi:hypothetical protein
MASTTIRMSAGVSGPVGIGLLDDDLPLVEEPGDEELDVELRVAALAEADDDVVDVDEEGEFLVFLAHAHWGRGSGDGFDDRRGGGGVGLGLEEGDLGGGSGGCFRRATRRGFRRSSATTWGSWFLL